MRHARRHRHEIGARRGSLWRPPAPQAALVLASAVLALVLATGLVAMSMLDARAERRRSRGEVRARIREGRADFPRPRAGIRGGGVHELRILTPPRDQRGDPDNRTATMTIIQPGAQAPDFELDSQLDKKFKLSDFKGEKNVILVFYPLDFTPT